MSELSEVRRTNIRALIEQRGGLSKLSRAMGYKNPSFLSQMTGPKTSREITEKTARKIEVALRLPAGVLDKQAGQPEQPLRDATVESIAAVIRMVGGVCEAEGVAPPVLKFAELVALAYSDSVERGVLREDHVKQLVRLVK